MVFGVLRHPFEIVLRAKPSEMNTNVSHGVFLDGIHDDTVHHVLDLIGLLGEVDKLLVPVIFIKDTNFFLPITVRALNEFLPPLEKKIVPVIAFLTPVIPRVFDTN